MVIPENEHPDLQYADEWMGMSDDEDPEEWGDDRIRPYFVDMMKCMNVPRFGGESYEACKFLSRLLSKYVEYDCSPSEGLMIAEYYMHDEAERWWKSMKEVVDIYYDGSAWGQFEKAFEEKYLTPKQKGKMVDVEIPMSGAKLPITEIAGMIKVEGKPARAMFDTGAVLSYVDEEYAVKKGLNLRDLPRPEGVVYADGSRTYATKVCKGCKVEIGGLCTRARLKVTKLRQWDVLLGMDWLGTYHAHINCKEGEIEFRLPGKPVVKFQGVQKEK